MKRTYTTTFDIKIRFAANNVLENAFPSPGMFKIQGMPNQASLYEGLSMARSVVSCCERPDDFRIDITRNIHFWCSQCQVYAGVRREKYDPKSAEIHRFKSFDPEDLRTTTITTFRFKCPSCREMTACSVHPF